ncbi:hypothetical protein [Succinimonas sp.]|uniref:hypothetical protein n=1 Tax=Succinimonas sp. TaxID=1936151 RepID=UPI0038704C45
MTEDEIIKTKEELEFAVFCVESIALALRRNPPEILSAPEQGKQHPHGLHYSLL